MTINGKSPEVAIMKWLMLILVIFSSVAYSKANEFYLAAATALPNEILEQQRGGFSYFEANYSIGLKMEALIGGQRHLFSNLLNIDKHSRHPQSISNVINVEGVQLRTIAGDGKLGFIVESSTSNSNNDYKLTLDVVTPLNINSYKRNIDVSTRLRDATRAAHY